MKLGTLLLRHAVIGVTQLEAALRNQVIYGGRLGTKQDAQNVLTLMQEASAQIKKDAQEGKCWDTVEKEFKMEKYATLPGYQAGLGMVARRYCALWGRGA